MFNFLKNLFGTTKEKVKKPHSPFYEEGAEDLDVNEIFQKMRPHLESFAVECIGIKTKEAKDLDLKVSKFGGLPFFPTEEPYPRDSRGEEMILLAQLNFAEIPHIAPYPEVGLLQFFISANGENFFGLTDGQQTRQEDWRVCWWENTNFEPRRDLKLNRKKNISPLMKESFSLEFFKQKNIPNYPSIEYQQDIEPLFNGAYEDILRERYFDIYEDNGHRIGGFPRFAQFDIRKFEKEYTDYKLLLQINSELKKIMWADFGVGLLFIKEEDLIKRDFSKVMYHSDCH